MEKLKRISLDAAIGFILYLTVFLSPIFFWGQLAQGFGLEKMIVFSFFTWLGVIAWVTKGILSGEMKIRRHPLDISILVFLVLFSLSAIMSVGAKDSLIGSFGNPEKGLLALITFSLFYLLVVNNVSGRRLKNMFWVLLSSLSLLSVFSLLQFFNIFLLPLDFSRQAGFTPVGSLSSLAALLAAGLPLLIVAFGHVKNMEKEAGEKAWMIIKVILGLLILVSLVCLFFLQGFVFLPALLVSVVVILMFVLAKIIKADKAGMVMPIAVFLVSVALLVLGNFHLAQIGLPAEVSLSRKASWDIAKASLKHDPLFGSGPATFYYDFFRYKNGDFNYSQIWGSGFNSASGLALEGLAVIGVLGTIAMIVVILTAVSMIFFGLIKAREEEYRPGLLAIASSLVSLLLYSFLFSVNASIAVVLIIITSLGIAYIRASRAEEEEVLKLALRSSPKYALSLAAIFLAVVAGVVVFFTLGFKMVAADYYARQAVASGDDLKKTELLTKAIDLFPYQENYYLELANSLMVLANKSVGDRNRLGEVENYLSLAIENGKKALEYSSNNAKVFESLALVYENASFYTSGALEWAENYYNKEKELDPMSPVPDLRIALINMARANSATDEESKKAHMESALKNYDNAIKKKNDLGAAYYGQAVAYEKLGNIDKAIEQLKKAVLSERDNIDYRFELGRLFFNQAVTKIGLDQTASSDIVKGDNNEGVLSVRPEGGTPGKVTRNEELNLAEQLFLGILQANPNHANSLYSLALLYQKLGEVDQAKMAVGRLLTVVQTEQEKEFIKKQFLGLY